MKKILIVDDDADVILFISTILQDQGYEVLTALNGDEGLLRVEKNQPDVVLLDLMMPQKSGIALLRDMKTEEGLKKIPVIMVTGVSGETGIDLEAFLQSAPGGGDGAFPWKPEGYIEKPVDPDKLVALIKEFIE